jgi:hypothetical protein
MDNSTAIHIRHRMQELSYHVNLRWENYSPMQIQRSRTVDSAALTVHRYVLKSLSRGPIIAFTAHFSPGKHIPSTPANVRKRNIKDWNNYWEKGGFVDLTASTNPNATELQRRIITSQYHVRVNSAANGQSPQESGLMNNGWYGRIGPQSEIS